MLAKSDPARSAWSSSNFTGLTRSALKPASRACRRWSSAPYPVSATNTVSPAPAWRASPVPPRTHPSPAGRCRANDVGLVGTGHGERLAAIMCGTHVVAEQLEEHGQALRRVPVVIDDQDALRGRASRHRVGSFRRAGRWCLREQRQAHDDSLPRPGPALVASTVPPCISVRRCTSVRPMPRPPSARS